MPKDWVGRLRLIMHRIKDVPEPNCDCFEAYPPAGHPWPEGVPQSPTLAAFYDVCGGGRFNVVSVSSASEILKITKDTEDWMEGLGDEEEDEAQGLPAPGQRWVFGHGEFGHAVFWDVPRDRVLFYNPDGGGWWDSPEDGPLAGLAMSKLWETLLFPAPDQGDGELALWNETMDMLEKLP